MCCEVLKSVADYEKACQRLYTLMQLENVSDNDEEANEMELLAILIEDYENKKYPIKVT
jgi:antitoxin component HigA of HigAB toxin-antitoxin module